MLLGSEPTEPGRCQAAAPQQTLNRLSVLMSTVELPQSFGIVIAIGESQAVQQETATVRGHGGETNGGKDGTSVAVITARCLRREPFSRASMLTE
jgi:hypothetical protein